MKKVSIIIPIYNQINCLGSIISAAISQSWSNLEIMLVNYGSLEANAAEYVKTDNRIRCLSVPGGGVDAILKGIKKSTGEYACFINPEDVIGPEFVANFMHNIEDIDVVAMGFFENDGKSIKEYRIFKDCVYQGEELDALKNNFLHEKGLGFVSNRIFFSICNKLYKREILVNLSVDFEKCKSVSSGYETLFTYLMLQRVSNIKTIASPNEYIRHLKSYASISSYKEMDFYLKQTRIAFDTYCEFINRYNGNIDQAYSLYYFMINPLIDRMCSETSPELEHAYKRIRLDEIFLSASKNVETVTFKENIKKKMLMFVPSQKIYFKVYRTLSKSRMVLSNIKAVLREPKIIIGDIKRNGVKKALELSKFRRVRQNGVADLKNQMELIENRIKPIISKWQFLKTDFDKCPIENNIFVFWWDGFENAPNLVKACLRSVVKHHQGYNVIKIDKDNFREYTDINKEVLRGFESGKISIQTFSDILRFNLLKNNGGVWIDSTLFFVDDFDLSAGLEFNSINSISYDFSNQFLDYKNRYCSWCSYYFASRKNSVFTKAMCDVFEQYYLQYRKYPIYFFTDAALMICKVYKIDEDALGKTTYSWGDMNFLASVLEKPYSASGEYIASIIPQKLSWRVNISQNSESYCKILKRSN